MNVIKKPYEISIWEDELVNNESYNPNNDLSLNSTYLKEKKLFVIGSDTMTGLNKVQSPKLTININGSHTLTFNLYKTYYDTELGDKVNNPFIPYLCNERKIKLKYENKWYDFIITKINKNSDKTVFSYTCQDLFIRELSRQGYNVELDLSLFNNTGTAVELGNKILENSNWAIDGENSDTFFETQSEPLYSLRIISRTAVDNLQYLLFDADGEYSIDNTTTPPSPAYEEYRGYISSNTYLLIPQSVYQKRQDIETVQFFIFNGHYSDNLSRGLDLSQVDLNEYLDYVDDEFNLRLNNDKIDSFIFPSLNLSQYNDEDFKITNFRARVLVKSPVYQYDNIIQKVVQVYLDQQNNDIYSFTENEFMSPTLVQNYIVNGRNYTSTSGWVPSSSASVKVDYYKTNYDENPIQPVLKCRFGTGSYIKNNCISGQASKIKSFSKGEKYVLRVLSTRRKLSPVKTPEKTYYGSDLAVSQGSSYYMTERGYWDPASESHGNWCPDYPLTEGRGICGKLAEYKLSNGQYILTKTYAHFAWGHTANYKYENDYPLPDTGGGNCQAVKNRQIEYFYPGEYDEQNNFRSLNKSIYMRLAFKTDLRYSLGATTSSNFYGSSNPLYIRPSSLNNDVYSLNDNNGNRININRYAHNVENEVDPFYIPYQTKFNNITIENSSYKYMIATISESLSENELRNKSIGLFLYSWGPYDFQSTSDWNKVKDLEKYGKPVRDGNRVTQDILIKDIQLFPFKTKPTLFKPSSSGTWDGIPTIGNELILPETTPINDELITNNYYCYKPLEQSIDFNQGGSVTIDLARFLNSYFSLIDMNHQNDSTKHYPLDPGQWQALFNYLRQGLYTYNELYLNDEYKLLFNNILNYNINNASVAARCQSIIPVASDMAEAERKLAFIIYELCTGLSAFVCYKYYYPIKDQNNNRLEKTCRDDNGFFNFDALMEEKKQLINQLDELNSIATLKPSVIKNEISTTNNTRYSTNGGYTLQLKSLNNNGNIPFSDGTWKGVGYLYKTINRNTVETDYQTFEILIEPILSTGADRMSGFDVHLILKNNSTELTTTTIQNIFENTASFSTNLTANLYLRADTNNNLFLLIRIDNHEYTINMPILCMTNYSNDEYYFTLLTKQSINNNVNNYSFPNYNNLYNWKVYSTVISSCKTKAQSDGLNSSSLIDIITSNNSQYIWGETANHVNLYNYLSDYNLNNFTGQLKRKILAIFFQLLRPLRSSPNDTGISLKDLSTNIWNYSFNSISSIIPLINKLAKFINPYVDKPAFTYHKEDLLVFQQYEYLFSQYHWCNIPSSLTDLTKIKAKYDNLIQLQDCFEYDNFSVSGFITATEHLTDVRQSKFLDTNSGGYGIQETFLLKNVFEDAQQFWSGYFIHSLRRFCISGSSRYGDSIGIYTYNDDTTIIPESNTIISILYNFLNFKKIGDTAIYENGSSVYDSATLPTNKANFSNFCDELSLLTPYLNEYCIFLNIAQTDSLEATHNLDKKDIHYVYVGSNHPSTSPYPNYTLKYQDDYIKRHTISVKQSNYLDAIQKICESFNCWAEYVIDHTENGEIGHDDPNDIRPIRRIIFKRIRGNFNYAGFKTGINLKSVTNNLDSTNFTSKLIVNDNSNDFGLNGFCSIARSIHNLTHENNLLNFSHYIYNQLISSSTTNMMTDLNNNYLLPLIQNNINKVELANELIGLMQAISSIEANRDFYKTGYESANDVANEALNYINDYLATSGSTLHFDTVEAAAKSTSTIITGNATLKNKQLELATNYANYINYYNFYLYWFQQYMTYSKKYISLLTSQKVLVKNVSDLNLALYKKYSHLIAESVWSSDDYMDDDSYYLDAIQKLNQANRPKSTYNINTISIDALQDYSNYNYGIGDKTYVYYNDFLDKPLEVVITEMTRELDSPDKDTVKVQNYKDNFSSLFQRITASVNQPK